MGDIIKLITDGGVPAYIIVAMGMFSLAVVFDRANVLFFKFNIGAKAFMEQVRALVQNDQIEEAISKCSGNEKAPLVHVIKHILERSDRDDEAIAKGQEIAIAEVMPSLGKRLNYLSMIANVATLVGLLGTIQGLIMSFAAVSQSDPAQKQAILSQGISMAMNTTALGLSVAIPTMIAYSILHARQNRHFEEIIEHSSKVVDLLSTRHYQPFQMNNVFPMASGNKKKDAPPPPRMKVV